MAETSLFWGGTTVGDAGPYTDDEFSDFIRDVMQGDPTTQAVLKGQLNELLVSNPAGTTIRVATGRALVDGKGYTNTANIDFSISAPGAGSNYYTVVLQKNFATQTVRAALLGPNAGAFPTVTQTDGTLWEISLATVQITSAGVITVTDTRVYSSPITQVGTTEIADGAITPAKLSSAAFPTTTKGDLIYANSATVLARLGKGTSGQFLKQGAVDIPEWATVPAILSSIPATVAGDILYASAANVLSKLAKGTSGHVLTQGASIPSWAAIPATAVGAVIAIGSDFGAPDQALSNNVLTTITGASISLSLSRKCTIIAFAAATVYMNTTTEGYGISLSLVIDGSADFAPDYPFNGVLNPIQNSGLTTFAFKDNVAAGTRTITLQAKSSMNGFVTNFKMLAIAISRD